MTFPNDDSPAGAAAHPGATQPVWEPSQSRPVPPPPQPGMHYPGQPVPPAAPYPGAGFSGPAAAPYPGAGFGSPAAQPAPPAPPYGAFPTPYGQQPMPYIPPVPGLGVDPLTGEPLSDKSKVAAGLLQLFLGGLGVGRFYLGHTGIAVTQLCLWIFGWITSFFLIGIPILLGVSIWALVDAILIFTGSVRDSYGRKLRT